MTDQEKLLEAIDAKIIKAQENVTQKEAFDKEINEIKGLIPDNVLKFDDRIKAAEDLAEKLSLKLKKIEEGENKTVAKTREGALKSAINEMTKSEDFKNWVEKGYKGEAPKVTVKYDITNDRTGNDLITTHSSFVRTEPLRAIHVRDLFQVVATDLPYYEFDKVTAMTNAADVASENGTAGEIDMTTAEETVSVKRIPAFMDISKRAAKSVIWLNSFLSKHLPAKIRNIEDWQLINGDGAGDNVDGIMKNAQDFDLAGASFSAGDIASIATYNSGAGVLITFAAAHGLQNGYKITFASATHSGYNATFSVNVKSPTVILIDKSYTAEADTSAWTATTAYWLADGVDNAQEADVLMAARAFLANGEYGITGHLINPADGAKMELFKDTTTNYLGGKKVERINGILYVGGIPCVETTAIAAGYFISGDFNLAAELMEFTALSLTFHTDTTYAKTNKIMALVEEEILFPILNPLMFVSGDFATAITALETP